jgi:DNA helicase IV
LRSFRLLTNTDAKLLRENAEKEIAAEIEAVKAARLAALATIEAEQVSLSWKHLGRTVTHYDEQGALISLKRKRSLFDEEDKDVSADLAAGGRMSNPKRLRNRRILRAVVQTTTAITIGAAVTWTALAFI